MTFPALGVPVAVIDVETTGLFPHRHDRVVEIAIVIIGADGELQQEFVSLINPGRDIGPTSIHGLTSADILHAPQFAEVASLMLSALTGTVAIAAHNIRFDRQFLKGEFARLKSDLPDFHTLCTMKLAGGGSLSDCCRRYGVTFEGNAHDALNDARAAARLLISLLADEPAVVQDLRQRPPIQWPSFLPSAKKPITRSQSRTHQAAPPTYLQRLFERKDNGSLSTADEGAGIAYGALLDRVLEDRRVEESEVDALVEMADNCGLSREQIQHVHRNYLDQLAVAAWADGVVAEAERRDLQMVAHLLRQENRSLDQILAEAKSQSADAILKRSAPPTDKDDLSGKRVCFTGELQCLLDGQPITREFAEVLAKGAGLSVLSSVTKKLDLLVLADPHSQSGKAKKAREYGVRILHEPVFWNAHGVVVT